MSKAIKEQTIHYKVIKGTSEKSASFDSSWTDLSKAQQRAKTLRASLRGSKIEVWVRPLASEDPVNEKPEKKGGRGD